MTFQDVQPHLIEVRDAVLRRSMPPWGAVKGFGEFRNDQGLSQEEIELIIDWIGGSARRGNNPRLLPPTPKFPKTARFKKPKNAIVIDRDFTLKQSIVLDGLWPERVRDGMEMQIVAELPDGRVEPLLWLYEFRNAFRQAFLLRKPIMLPQGTVIRGVPDKAQMALLPATKPSTSKSD